jgi:hypothetical protein
MQYVDRSARDSISIRPSRHRDFRRQWRREPIRRQRTSVSARGCHPCLGDDLLPMSPGRTFEYLVAGDRYGLKPRVTRLSSPSIALENRRRNELSGSLPRFTSRPITTTPTSETATPTGTIGTATTAIHGLLPLAAGLSTCRRNAATRCALSRDCQLRSGQVVGKDFPKKGNWFPQTLLTPAQLAVSMLGRRQRGDSLGWQASFTSERTHNMVQFSRSRSVSRRCVGLLPRDKLLERR